MYRNIFGVLMALAILTGTSRCTTWVANSSVAFGEPYSLEWCIASAATGDTVQMPAGIYEGGVHIIKDITIIGASMQETAITAPTWPLVVEGCNTMIRNLTVRSYAPRGADLVVWVNNATISMDSIAIESITPAGTSVLIQRNSTAYLASCDLRRGPIGYLIQLLDCGYNTVTTGCLWPTTDTDSLSRIIWDKEDDAALGLVVR